VLTNKRRAAPPGGPSLVKSDLGLRASYRRLRSSITAPPSASSASELGSGIGM
jgi:hypothetical protein